MFTCIPAMVFLGHEVNTFLQAKGKVHEFPLFTAVHEIVHEGRDASTLVDIDRLS